MRNYDNTGASDSTGRNWVNVLMNDHVFELPNGSKKASISAYLDGATMRWREAIGKIPDRWEVALLVSAKITDKEEQYIIQLSSHWKAPLLSNVVNALLGELAGADWQQAPDERFICIELNEYKTATDGDLTTSSGLLYRDKDKTWAKKKFEWNQALKKYEGIPEFDWQTPEGRKQIDNFWIGQVALMVGLLGGTIDYKGATIAPPKDDSEAHGWLNEVLAGGRRMAQSTAPAPESTTPARTEPAATVSAVDKAKKWFEGQIAAEGAVFRDVLAQLADLARKNSVPAADIRLLAGWINTEGTRLKWFESGWHVKENLTLEPPPVEATDDLPF